MLLSTKSAHIRYNTDNMGRKAERCNTLNTVKLLNYIYFFRGKNKMSLKTKTVHPMFIPAEMQLCRGRRVGGRGMPVDVERGSMKKILCKETISFIIIICLKLNRLDCKITLYSCANPDIKFIFILYIFYFILYKL